MFLIIAGHPATGKTTLTKKLEELYPDHMIFHTDDYMEFGYKESIYKLIDDLNEFGFTKIIVEGIMGARLMRKLQEAHPEIAKSVDLFIYITAKFDHIIDVYTRERPDKSLASVESAIKGLDTVKASINFDTLPNLNINISDFAENNTIPDLISKHLK